MGQLPNNEIPENRAHLTQRQQTQEGKEHQMFISITKNGDKIGAAIIGETLEEFQQEVDNEEDILFHEPMFGKEEEDYGTGENVITAIARTAGVDISGHPDDSPGSALEQLVRQVFLLGVVHGKKTERERIISRITG